MTKTNRIFRGAVVLCAVLVLSAAGIGAAGCDGVDDAEVIDVTLTADGGALTIDVSPEEATIYMGGESPSRACWQVSGLADGHTLRLEAKDPDNDIFPQAVFTISSAGGRAVAAEPTRTGSWTYNVLVMKGSKEVARRDPVIIIGGGGGGVSENPGDGE